MAYPLLGRIDSPADLRTLERAELPALAAELRAFLIDSVSQTGGHLSSNLGTVELTIALHYVFNTPEDRIVWDVGHQAYSHKILTGRREAMRGLRRKGGISGFPKRAESEYDTFVAGHSSTSISAALGMAVAARDKGERRAAIALIGDGAMSAGIAFEALNNAGDMKDVNLLVILNDNEMSISPPVGALSNILARLMTPYGAARKLGKKVLRAAPPPVAELARKMEEYAKGMIAPGSPGTLFEEFGFHYYGPVDGHDLELLVPMLQNLRGYEGPQFLHIVTRKGQGYKLAEADPVLYHGVGQFDARIGIAAQPPGGKPTYTQVFGDWLCDEAARDARVVGITPAMCEGSGLTRFAREFPARYFDVGIAEQHALTFAAGMACEGMRPVVAIYSTFLQRAYDQLIHDIALQNLPVLLAIDRSGIVGADGSTHQGAFDLSFLACVPNMVVMTPADENECRQMLHTALQHDGPAAVRYPRGKGPGVAPQAELRALPLGQGEIRRRGQKTALLAFGGMLAPALEAGETLDATVANMRFVKPLDAALVAELAAHHELLVTIEENTLIGGAGSEVARLLDALPQRPRLIRLGLPDRFIEHGEQHQTLAELGLDAAGIISAVRSTPQNN
ncbi:MAG: 1-deoxy-D-xylulose-5-phosphate synthase [Azoarcus sp.]|jgi:1-deoxy-D-xylulose-5-phosphate synthase|nr:1-deoxy-D-xylulose-5-phosphate synthase [Azoarcus sp.]